MLCVLEWSGWLVAIRQRRQRREEGTACGYLLTQLYDTTPINLGISLVCVRFGGKDFSSKQQMV